jgi:pyridoxal phosphate enzyme (YggS family)
MVTIAENINAINAKIAKAKSGAKLIAVSKNHPASSVEEAINAGQLLFGENRVQEAAAKFPLLRQKHPNLELHLIGPLQTNKVKDALSLFDVIQTVDREKLALEISKQLSASSSLLTTRFFIQVNIGEEPQKAGIAPQQTVEFFRFCTKDLGLNVTGLMAIPPLGEPAFLYFGLLKNIAKQLSNSATGQLALSMGMSADFEDALAFDTNYIRVGTAIFGERQKTD